MQELIIIAAMAKNHVIGKNDALPWALKEGLGNFKELTMGWPCIMGRKTWESLPKKPLPGRLNIVVSSSVPKDELCPQQRALSPTTSSVPKDELCPQQRALSPTASSVPKDNIITLPSLQAAINYCTSYEKVFICGGETVYKQALSLADKIELTLIHKEYEGDTFFPDIDPVCWAITNKVDFDTFSLITYTRRDRDELCPQGAQKTSFVPKNKELP
jgi:dihydrofolate reductase